MEQAKSYLHLYQETSIQLKSSTTRLDFALPIWETTLNSSEQHVRAAQLPNNSPFDTITILPILFTTLRLNNILIFPLVAQLTEPWFGATLVLTAHIKSSLFLLRASIRGLSKTRTQDFAWIWIVEASKLINGNVKVLLKVSNGISFLTQLPLLHVRNNII